MVERILVVGGGGREHAINRALAESVEERTSVDSEEYYLYGCASNRNPGIVDLVDQFEVLDETDPTAVAAYATNLEATMVVVGPDDPLSTGVVDELESRGIYTFAPAKDPARIETDKAYQREFMLEHDIPGCPDFEIFTSTDAACEYIDTDHDTPVVKPAGLTGGKGVRIIGDQISPVEAKEYLRESEYKKVIFEEELIGEEITVQAITANNSIRVTPVVHDHGRAHEGDTGPNTGGMGSITGPDGKLPFVQDAEYDEAAEIVRQTIDALDEFKGVLYGQFMLTAKGPKVVEFNARFGDPEAMNTVPTLKTNFIDILKAGRAGEPLPELQFSSLATVCKYVVPDGYPTDPTVGVPAYPVSDHDNLDVYYASVDQEEDDYVTTSSRCFAYVGFGESIVEAEAAVENALADTNLTGLYARHDIGTTELIQQRIDHMDRLRSS